VLTAQQVEAVLAQADPAEGLGLRDRAILEVLCSTGLRRGEVIRLAVDGLDHDCGTVLVRQGKHAKERIVTIGDRALEFYTRVGAIKLKAVHSDTRPAQLAGTRSAAAEPKTDPESDLFEALDAEAEASRE
jgi:integrase/recombinase XerD